jgi:hypothetical protein
VAPDAVGKGRRGRRLCERERWSLLKRAVWTVLVVMADVGAHDLLEVAAAEHQKAVEAFASQAAHPALRMCLRFRRLYRRPNHTNTLGAEHLVEAARELAVAIADEEKRTGCSCSARVITRLRACWVTQRSFGFAVTTEVDAAARELDEELHVQTPQPNGVDGEKVTGDDRGRLRAQEV